MGVLILNKDEVKKTLSMDEVIEGVKNVYKLKAEGNSVIWPLVNYEFEEEKAAMDIRSGYIKGEQLHGMKMLNNFPGNRQKGLEPFNGIMLVYDSDTGIPIGLLDASYITCMRTGAAGALGAKLLAKKDAKNLMILGAGKQAVYQIAASLILFDTLEKIFIVDPMDSDNAVKFVEGIEDRLKTEFDIDTKGKVEFVSCDNIEEPVKKSQIIITVTPSKEGIIKKEWVQKGTHLSCLGSDMEGKQEIDEEIFENAKVYVDDIAQCIRVGEIEKAVEKDILTKDKITGEIGNVINNTVVGRENDEEITVFDATGLYILDLISSKIAINKARELNIGIEMDM